MGLETYISLFFSVVGIVAVLIFTYYGSKWVAKRYSVSSSNKKIRIIDRAMIGKDKYIVVADIYNGKYIIGVSGQQITLLKDMGEIELPEETTDAPEDFSTIFSAMLKNQIHQVRGRFSSKGEKQE